MTRPSILEINRVKAAFRKYLLADLRPNIVQVSRVKVSQVFEAYFENKAPFGSSKKKNEFPDAFSLYALEDECIQENKKIYVVSSDQDMKAYCQTSDNLYYLSSLSQFIDLINSEDNQLSDKIHKWFPENYGLILQYVREEFEAKIKLYGVSIEGLPGVIPHLDKLELEQQVYSLYFPTSYAYAYAKAHVTFIAQGLYSKAWLKKQLGFIPEHIVSEKLQFEAVWEVSYEVEIELEYKPSRDVMQLVGVSVLVGSIQLNLEDSNKFTVI